MRPFLHLQSLKQEKKKKKEEKNPQSQSLKDTADALMASDAALSRWLQHEDDYNCKSSGRDSGLQSVKSISALQAEPIAAPIVQSFSMSACSLLSSACKAEIDLTECSPESWPALLQSSS